MEISALQRRAFSDAIIEGKVGQVRELLKQGVPLFEKSRPKREFFSPLTYLFFNANVYPGMIRMVLSYLKKNPEILKKMLNGKDDNGSGLIHLMARSDELGARPDLFDAWIKVGVKIHGQDKCGNNALAVASPSVVPHLIRAGVSMYQTNVLGLSPVFNALLDLNQLPTVGPMWGGSTYIKRLEQFLLHGWDESLDPTQKNFSRLFEKAAKRIKGSPVMQDEIGTDFDRLSSLYRRQKLTQQIQSSEVKHQISTPKM